MNQNKCLVLKQITHIQTKFGRFEAVTCICQVKWSNQTSSVLCAWHYSLSPHPSMHTLCCFQGAWRWVREKKSATKNLETKMAHITSGLLCYYVRMFLRLQSWCFFLAHELSLNWRHNHWFGSLVIAHHKIDLHMLVFAIPFHKAFCSSIFTHCLCFLRHHCKFSIPHMFPTLRACLDCTGVYQKSITRPCRFQSNVSNGSA